MPRIVSPGCSSARNTAWLACAPECGCTLANAQPKQLLRAVDRQLLGDIDIDAAAVVAPAGIALGVFVGQHRALRLQHRGGDDVLAGDQLDAVLLAHQLGADGGGELGVGLGERGGEEPLQAGGGRLLVHDPDH